MNEEKEKLEDKEKAEEKKFDNKPIVETQINLSKDGKWLIHKTIITDIKSVNFYDVVLGRQKPTPPQ